MVSTQKKPPRPVGEATGGCKVKYEHWTNQVSVRLVFLTRYFREPGYPAR